MNTSLFIKSPIIEPKPLPVYTLLVQVMTHSKTLGIEWKLKWYNIPLSGETSLNGIHECLLHRIRWISKKKGIPIEENRFFLFVLGERLSALPDNKETAIEVTNEIQSRGGCFIMEDTR